MITVTQMQQEMLAAEKGRRKREQREREGRDLALHTGNDDVAQGMRDAAEAEALEAEARKNYADRGAELGPGEGVMPGHPQPASFDRGYVEPGHASPSPQAEGPRTNPMLAMTHRVLPDMPYASSIPQHVVAQFTMGSPSERAR